jgi:hypothetical protein
LLLLQLLLLQLLLLLLALSCCLQVCFTCVWHMEGQNVGLGSPGHPVQQSGQQG